jgi:hypothetical protein
MSKDEIKLPNYPALAAVLLVESRFGSRQALEKDLSATDLFLERKTAQSLATAKLTLELEHIDVLVVGPSLSNNAKDELLTWASANARSKDCAFLLIYETPPESVPPLAHSYAVKPLTKASLFDAIVRGVVRVNKDSPWQAIFQNSEFHRQFDNSSPLLASSAKRTVSGEAITNLEAVLGLHSLLRATPEEVQKVFQERNLIFTSTGEPTAELRSAALKIMDSLFGAGLAENERFMRHCTKAVYAWFENAPLGGIQEANEQLKITIWQFRG